MTLSHDWDKEAQKLLLAYQHMGYTHAHRVIADTLNRLHRQTRSEEREAIRQEIVEWLDCTGVIPKGTSYYAELLGCVDVERSES